MAKLYVKNRYGVTPDSVLNHRLLSWKAKGIYGYIQSKPENWDFAISRFEGKDGKDSTQSGVWELEEFGYLNREKKRQPDGTWDIEYTLYASPEDNPHHGGKPAMDELSTMEENPAQENPAQENPPTIKDIPIQTEVIKQIVIINEEIEKNEEIKFPSVSIPDGMEEELKEFIAYWTETSKSGKQRWQGEKFFDPQKRWATWVRNAERWNKKSSNSNSKNFVGTA